MWIRRLIFGSPQQEALVNWKDLISLTSEKLLSLCSRYDLIREASDYQRIADDFETIAELYARPIWSMLIPIIFCDDILLLGWNAASALTGRHRQCFSHTHLTQLYWAV